MTRPEERLLAEVKLPDPLSEILHLGCGKKKIEGALGVDTVREEGVDVVWDLNITPWPFPSDAFAEVHMISILEHCEDILSIMDEVYRVCRKDAEVHIEAPFASSHHLWTDPTHKRGFTSRSFKYFDEDFCSRHFEYSKSRFQCLDVTYRMHGPKWYDRILLNLANRYKFKYEKRFMYWYPVENIYFRLKALK